MRWRLFTWLWLSVLLSALLFCCLRHQAPSKSLATRHPTLDTRPSSHASLPTPPADPSTLNHPSSIVLLTKEDQLSTISPFPFLLKNTSKSPGQLARSDKAI